MYVTVTDVRTIIGLTVRDITDEDLEELIALAERMVNKDITIFVYGEVPTFYTDSSTIRVKFYPIGDRDIDGSVSTNDVSIYGWTDADDISTRTTVSVSAVYPSDGVIVASTNLDYEKVTVDYCYFPNDGIDWELVKLATIYLVGYLYAIRKFTTLPDSVSRGPIRYRYYARPYDEYYRKYYEILDRILSKRSCVATRSGDC